MEKISTSDGSMFMQILTEFYRQNHSAEKSEKPNTKRIEVSDEASKTGKKVRGALRV